MHIIFDFNNFIKKKLLVSPENIMNIVPKTGRVAAAPGYAMIFEKKKIGVKSNTKPIVKIILDTFMDLHLYLLEIKTTKDPQRNSQARVGNK